MTGTDLYVTVCRLAIIGSAAIAIGWAVEHREGLHQAWVDYRRRASDLRRVRNSQRLMNDLAEYHGMPLSDAVEKVGRAMTVDAEGLSSGLRGVVGNRSDPSPMPYVQRFKSRFPRP